MFLSLLRRKDNDKNYTQKLHSAAVVIISILSVICQAVCVSSYYDSLFLPVVFWNR